MKKIKFLSFGRPPVSPAFWPNFFGPNAKNQNSAPNIFLPCPLIYEKVNTPTLPQKVEKDYVVKALFGVWA